MNKKKLNGYILVYIPDHPKALKSRGYKGWVYEHVVVAEKFMKRPLNKDEHVHHLDFDRSNDHPSNLLVILASQHAKLHAFLRRGGKSLVTSSCRVCGEDTEYGTYCSKECRGFKSRKVQNRPSKEELLEMLKTESFVSLGRKFGVSDNAIRKWLK